VLGGYTATRDGLNQGFPFVRAEPGGCNARVGDMENGDGEGLESGCGGDGEVDDLGGVMLVVVFGKAGVSQHDVMTYSSICEVHDA
jgi:hypothetical protein